MSGTFIATPSKALTIEHEPQGRELTQFKPEEARGDLEKIETLASYGVNLRDDIKLYELAVKKLEIIVDIIDWWARHVQPSSKIDPEFWRTAGPPSPAGHRGFLSAAKALEILGYNPTNHQAPYRWRKLAKAAENDTDATVARIVDGWKMRAGITAKEPKKPTEGPTIVEKAMRLVLKMTPDEYEEFKVKLLQFDRARRMPIDQVEVMK